jgi:hypothetical protein
MRYESTGIVVVPGTNCDRNDVRQLLDETGNFTGLFPRGLDLDMSSKSPAIQTRS